MSQPIFDDDALVIVPTESAPYVGGLKALKREIMDSRSLGLKLPKVYLKIDGDLERLALVESFDMELQPTWVLRDDSIRDRVEPLTFTLD